MMLLQAGLSVAEPMINKALRYDFDAATKLAMLEGKSLSVELTDLRQALNISVLHGKVRLSSNIEIRDCYVKTELSQLQNLSDASQITSLIKADLLDLEGNLSVAQQFSSLFMENQIDWQEWTSEYFGDAVTHKLFSHGHQLRKKLKKKRSDLDYIVHSLLTDELNLVPSSIEQALYADEVDLVSARTEKLLSQFKKLKASL
jgi:ubiquinone biosynthesis accessory factor UbiJ